MADVSLTTHLIERALAAEFLKSERLRVTLGIALMSAALAFVTLVLTLRAEDFAGHMARPERRYLILVAPLSLIGIMAAYRRYVGRCVAEGRALRPALRYVEVTLEITAVSGALAFFCVNFGATAGLVSPPAFMYPLICALLTLSLDPRACLLAGAIAGSEYLALYLAFRDQLALESPGSFLAAAAPFAVRVMAFTLGGVIGALVAVELKRRAISTLRAAQEQTRLRHVFGQHVSPEVADKLLAAGESALAPESRHVCVMFLDVRGFTKFSERRAPDEIMTYLGALLEPLIECVDKHGGIVNKLLGDGFMAVFGAPLPDERPERGAVASALEQLELVDALVARGVLPPTRVGIGLHAGIAVTGNLGSSRRKEFTVIGDTVNLAARIEGLNKRHDARLLASAEVVAALDASARARAEDLGDVHIRGRGAPVRLFRLA